MERDTYHSKLLTWGIWISALAAAGFMAADVLVRMPNLWLRMMPIYCLAAFALMHGFTFMGVRRGFWFLALGLIIPYIAEYIGINFGAIFGGHWYRLARDLGITVGVMLPGRVPLAMVLSWYGMLYVTFISSVYLLKAKESDVSSFATVPLATGLLMAMWQVAAGPATIGRAMMGFAQNGFYHSIPLSHFAGWFMVAMFVTLFFQAVEPGAVNADRFKEPVQRVAPLAFLLYGASVLYALGVCLRLGFNGAGWLGVTILLLFTLAMMVRAKAPRPVVQLREQPSASS